MAEPPEVMRAVEQIREEWGANDAARDAGLPTHPDDIERVDDIVYGTTDERWQRLDVYRPADAKGKALPVIVSVHGGGWVYGSKETYQFYCMELARRGFGVVNFSYRLAPEWKFPTPFEDTNLVMGWLMEHGAGYGLDTSRVFAVGDSAGGHLLALYAALTTNPELAKRFLLADGRPIEIPEGLEFRAVALNCGEYKVLFDQEGQDLTTTLMAAYLPGDGTTEEIALMDVTAHVTKDYPPAFIMTATGDFLLEQAPVMAKKLAETSVPFVFRFYGDKDHSLGHVFHCHVKTPEAKRCNDDECAFFRLYL